MLVVFGVLSSVNETFAQRGARHGRIAQKTIKLTHSLIASMPHASKQQYSYIFFDKKCYLG